MAKAYRVGTVVDGSIVLQSVHRFGAALGPPGGPAQVRLELPQLPPPATGTLPAVPGAAPVPAVAPVPAFRPAMRPPIAPQVAQPVVEDAAQDDEPEQDPNNN
jgi:general secretion pathway protein C